MKFYKVLKDNFLWEEGAVLKQTSEDDNFSGYKQVDDIFCKNELTTEYISKQIVENQPDWFVRVYPVNLIKKTLYLCKEETKKMLLKEYK